MKKGGRHDQNNMTLNNNFAKRGGGHDDNNMTLNNKIVKRGALRKQYDPKQQGCEKGTMTKTI